ncbi:MAG: carbamate kinase, partial [Deltaproteobacteria bacterium]|nr:carbamate kinase [Deltaproteobacteria bacterium]
GNAISREFEEGNITQQFENTRRSLRSVVEFIRQGYQVVITHGNGPQVGNALVRVEETRHLVPPLPLGIIVADLEGGMGYMIEQCLYNKLHDRGFPRQVITVLTQVLVDKDDHSILNPSKFVGPFFKKEQVKKLEQERGWIIKEDRGRGFRRVVPSPIPKEIVEKEIIKLLVDKNIIVIAAGGGGIPVYREESGWLEGVDGVIDKDLASAVLARDINAQELLILTGVDRVALNYKQPNQQDLSRMTLSEARHYLSEGQFPKGSMGPKIQAAINFLESGGEKVIITSIEKALAALANESGTVLTVN